MTCADTSAVTARFRPVHAQWPERTRSHRSEMRAEADELFRSEDRVGEDDNPWDRAW